MSWKVLETGIIGWEVMFCCQYQILHKLIYGFDLVASTLARRNGSFLLKENVEGKVVSSLVCLPLDWVLQCSA